MAAVAFVGAWRQALNAHIAASGGSSGNTPGDILRISIVQTVGWGGMLAITVLGLCWRFGRGHVRWEPGQWLAAYGTADFAHTFFGTLPKLLSTHTAGDEMVLHLRRDLAFHLGCAVVLGAVAIWPRYSLRWRVALGTLALQPLLYAVAICALMIAARIAPDDAFSVPWLWYTVEACRYATVVSPCVIALVAGSELHAVHRWSWAHWIGLTLWLGKAAIELAARFNWV